MKGGILCPSISPIEFIGKSAKEKKGEEDEGFKLRRLASIEVFLNLIGSLCFAKLQRLLVSIPYPVLLFYVVNSSLETLTLLIISSVEFDDSSFDLILVSF